MPNNISSNKRLAKNTIFLSIRMVIVLLITFYTTRVVLNVLGVVDYGVYNVVCGFVTMFAFLNTSMSNGIQRFFNFEYGKNGEEGANKVYCTAIYIQAFLAIIVVVLVEIFGLWYLHNKMVIPADRMVAAEWIFQFAVLTFVMGIMQAPYAAAVTAHEKFDFYAIVSVLDAMLKLGVVFLIKNYPADRLIAYGFLIAVISVINILLYFSYCKIKFKEIHFHKGLDKRRFKEMLGFSGWNLFGSFSSVMKEQGINLVINFFFGPIVNAARGVSHQVNAGIQGFVTNLTTPVRPQVVQSYAQGNIDRTFSLTYSISKLSSCFFLMMAIPASLEIDFVLRLWLGSKVPAHTNYFTIIILATSLINILNGAISTIVHATGKMKEYQLWGSLFGIASVPIAFLLLEFYSQPEIALLAVLFCTVVGHIISLIIVRKLVNLSLKEYAIRVVFPICIVSIITLIASAPIRLIMGEGFLRLLIIIVVCVVVVCLSSFFIAFSENERKLTLQLLKPVFSIFSRLKINK